MRIAFFDLETSDLEGDKGRLLCASILDDVKMTSFRNDCMSRFMDDDHAISVAVRDYLESYHMTVGWFSKGFDIAFLNSRLVKYGERPLRSMLHLDGVWYCKGWRGIKARSASMKVMAEFFSLERKQDVDIDVWIKAALGGNREAMDILVERCESDVRITKQLTEKILDTGLVKNIGVYP